MKISRRGFIGTLAALPAVRLVRIYEAKVPESSGAPAILRLSAIIPATTATAPDMIWSSTDIVVNHGDALLAEVQNGQIAIDLVKRS